MSSYAKHIIIRNVSFANDNQRHMLVIKDGLIDSCVSNERNSETPIATTEDNDNILQLDASQLLAVPGLTDLFSRLREPGQTRKGTIAKESSAALAAGFTTVVCAPDTDPAIDSVATVELVRRRAQVADAAHVIPMAALTVGLQGNNLSELATLQLAGCLIAGQADHHQYSTSVLYSAMEYAASFNLPLFMTPRDSQLGAGGCAHTGALATQLGLPGIPVAAETVALARLLELCRETRCPLHISRISTARSVEMIDNAKQAALPVTCDTGLHHLFFTDEHLAGYDASFHSAVPFRSEADRDALRVGLFNGVIDAICSDHAPHDVDASLAPFPSTQAGLSAYAFALPLILQLPELTGMSLTQILKTLSEIPDRILHGTSTSGLEVGKSANFLLLQTDVPSSHPTSVAGSMGINHPLFSHSPESLKLAPLKGQVCYAFCHDRVHAINALDTATH